MSATPTDYAQALQAMGVVPPNAAEFGALIAKTAKFVSKQDAANFLGQTAHESRCYTRMVENLNYSALGLLKTWPNRFTHDTAEKYARKPERIANCVYANRLGNGTEESGEGWKYRGRGLIQVTGKANYGKVSGALGVNFLDNPELLEKPQWAVQSALWYWQDKKLSRFGDDIEGLTRAINGGLNGLADRKQLTKLALDAL